MESAQVSIHHPSMMDLVARPNWVLRALVKNPIVIVYEMSFFVEIRDGNAKVTHWQDALRTSATSGEYNRTRLPKNYVNILSLFRFFTGPQAGKFPRTPLLLIQASLSFFSAECGQGFSKKGEILMTEEDRQGK